MSFIPRFTLFISGFILYRRWSLDNEVISRVEHTFVCDSCSWSSQSFLSQNHRVIICHKLKLCTIIREIPQNYHIFLYLEPTWPLFSLKFRPSFGGFNPQNKGQTGSRYLYGLIPPNKWVTSPLLKDQGSIASKTDSNILVHKILKSCIPGSKVAIGG